jgi:SAM-dependent methyltransferase
MAFDNKLYQVLSRSEADHWFFLGRRYVLSTLLKQYCPRDADLALDLGCSTGSNRETLLKFSERVIGIDREWEVLRLGLPVDSAPLCQADAVYLPFTDRCFDLVVALDLFEHLPDEDRGIREIWRVLKTGGCLVIFVPAFEWIWSKMDKVAHHYRRYTAGRLRRLLINQAFLIHRVTYVNMLLFPLMVVYRLMQRLIHRGWDNNRLPELKIPPGPINHFLTGVLAMEAHLIRFVNLPVGGTVIAVAQRQAAMPVEGRRGRH